MKLPADWLRRNARQVVRDFNQHTRSCPDCDPPRMLCFVGAEFDRMASQAAAEALRAKVVASSRH